MMIGASRWSIRFFDCSPFFGSVSNTPLEQRQPEAFKCSPVPATNHFHQLSNALPHSRRSIFSNSQLALDNMQNINQNDFLQNSYDAHVMQFFVSSGLLLRSFRILFEILFESYSNDSNLTSNLLSFQLLFMHFHFRTIKPLPAARLMIRPC